MKRHAWLFLAAHLVSAISMFGETPAERSFASRVSQKWLVQTVRELVRLGPRSGGTISGDKSAEYVAKRLRSIGLNVEMVEDSEKLTYSHGNWSLKVEEPLTLKRLIKNEWLAGFSPPTERTKAPLVRLSADEDLEAIDFKGAVVLVDHGFTLKLYKKLSDGGALCILLASPNMTGAYSSWSLITNLMPAKDNPIPLYNISSQNAEKLKSTLSRGINVIVSFSARTTVALGKPKTVIATMRGKTSEYFIVCAHGDSDSGGPGADDNASGVSGVLEIARCLNSLVRSKTIPQPTRTIKFIIWGSEYNSSEYYVRQHHQELDQILGVLNFDEIGTGATRNCLYFESNDVEHNEALLRTLQEIGEEFVGRKGFWEEATTNPSQGGTDSYVFLPEYLKYLKLPDAKIPSTTIYTAAWNELKAIPQTNGWSAKSWKGPPDTVIVDYSAYYHSSRDIPSVTTDKEPFNMTWAVKAVGIALLRLAWE